MIGYNLERFADAPANLEHVTLYLIIWWTKNGTLSIDFPWDTFTPSGIHAHPTGRVMVKFKLKLVRPEKK